ncbi:hypothetical protein PPTG_01201 [Phytophthora nicotianae INRA-310]|uniref:WW domain-containing protein n=1 Tax=Phytophthora nicotianae (strain INRA-310) TaxID=761204 RepID=W2RKB0_PHYN3|nr:hypothetical protein PPTG_01201 [Phytophthora nicotianae INRA-310]ETN25074.1 hypothetical protein PPTG_01201 [Phytophthora nicotianae INRA-310]
MTPAARFTTGTRSQERHPKPPPPSQFRTGSDIHPWTKGLDDNGHVYYHNTSRKGEEEDHHIAYHDETSEALTPELDSENALNSEDCPWMIFINEDDGVPYEYNHITGECLWEPPQEFCRFDKDKPQQEHQQLDELNVETAKLELPVIGDTAEPQGGSANSTPNSGMPDKTALQVIINLEFRRESATSNCGSLQYTGGPK